MSGYYPPCSSCTVPQDYATYEQSDATVTGLSISTIKVTTDSTTATITANDSLGATDATYQFSIASTLAIPTEGVMVLTVPSGVTVPSDSVSGFSMSCSAGCTSAGTLSYDSSTRELKI